MVRPTPEIRCRSPGSGPPTAGLSAKQLVELEKEALSGVEAEDVKQRIKKALARLSAPDKDVQDSLPLKLLDSTS